MKTFGQLAQSAYEAYRKRMLESGSYCLENNNPPWEQLATNQQGDWIAVAKQLWAEFAAMH